MFKITTTYDHKALTALNRVLRKTFKYRVYLITRVLMWLFLAVEAALMAILYAVGGFTWDSTTVLSCVVALAVLLLIFFEDHLNAWISAGMTFGYRQAVESVVDENEYSVNVAGASGHWSYETVRIFAETADYFVFLIDKRHGQLFDKKGFTEGTPEDFRRFVTEKTGLNVQFVK